MQISSSYDFPFQRYIVLKMNM